MNALAISQLVLHTVASTSSTTEVRPGAIGLHGLSLEGGYKGTDISPKRGHAVGGVSYFLITPITNIKFSLFTGGDAPFEARLWIEHLGISWFCDPIAGDRLCMRAETSGLVRYQPAKRTAGFISGSLGVTFNPRVVVLGFLGGVAGSCG